jgi:hypothetical protein
MKKLFAVIFLFAIISKSFGQTNEFCSPKFIENISNQIVQKLTSNEIKEIKNYRLNSEKDWRTEIDINLNTHRILNYEDFLPIIEYTKSISPNELSQYQLERIITEYTFSKIKKSPSCLSEIVNNQLAISDKQRLELERRITKDTLDGTYIPKNLEDAIKVLDSRLSGELKSEIINLSEEKFRAESHFGIGLTLIRNGWSLWSKSRLSMFFEDKGISHPDDMSGIILTSYHRRLNGKSIEIEKQITEYKEYQLKNNQPSKMEFPSYVKDVSWKNSRGYPEDKAENNWADLHFFVSLDNKVIWINNYKYGWKKLTKKQFRKSEKLYDYEIPNWLEKTYNVKK